MTLGRYPTSRVCCIFFMCLANSTKSLSLCSLSSLQYFFLSSHIVSRCAFSHTYFTMMYSSSFLRMLSGAQRDSSQTLYSVCMPAYNTADSPSTEHNDTNAQNASTKYMGVSLLYILLQNCFTSLGWLQGWAFLCQDSEQGIHIILSWWRFLAIAILNVTLSKHPGCPETCKYPNPPQHYLSRMSSLRMRWWTEGLNAWGLATQSQLRATKRANPLMILVATAWQLAMIRSSWLSSMVLNWRRIEVQARVMCRDLCKSLRDKYASVMGIVSALVGGAKQSTEELLKLYPRSRYSVETVAPKSRVVQLPLTFTTHSTSLLSRTARKQQQSTYGLVREEQKQCQGCITTLLFLSMWGSCIMGCLLVVNISVKYAPIYQCSVGYILENTVQ